jgi:hypothetical protein
MLQATGVMGETVGGGLDKASNWDCAHDSPNQPN